MLHKIFLCHTMKSIHYFFPNLPMPVKKKKATKKKATKKAATKRKVKTKKAKSKKKK